MINSLLEEIYQIQFVDPMVFNFKTLAGYVTLIFGAVMWILYLLMGLSTSYYKYEILTDGDKRYINKTPDKARIADATVVSAFCMVFGMTVSLTHIISAITDSAVRILKRVKQINVVIAKHQKQTFDELNVKVSVSLWGGILRFEWPERTEAVEDKRSTKLVEEAPKTVVLTNLVGPKERHTNAGTTVGEGNFNDVFNRGQEPNESAQLLASRKRDYESGLDVPEEQPL